MANVLLIQRSNTAKLQSGQLLCIVPFFALTLVDYVYVLHKYYCVVLSQFPCYCTNCITTVAAKLTANRLVSWVSPVLTS